MRFDIYNKKKTHTHSIAEPGPGLSLSGPNDTLTRAVIEKPHAGGLSEP